MDALMPGFSPRLEGQCEESVRLLSEVDGVLPPILVHRATNRVIDGMHRLLAARRLGRETIAVRYFDGDEASAFVLAVHANAAGRLPLKDRKVAAARILASHPHWSDRRIAGVAGLSDKTVAAVRACTCPLGAAHGDPAPRIEVEGRVGADGRVRPLDPAARRVAVARLLAQEPDASLRQIAAQAGVSPETVRTVKAAVKTTGGRAIEGPGMAADTEPGAGPSLRLAGSEARRWLRVLAGDPAFRATDAGRRLLRLLSTFPVLEREASGLLEAVPEHDLDFLRRLALAHADAWRVLAELAVLRIRQADAADASQPSAG